MEWLVTPQQTAFHNLEQWPLTPVTLGINHHLERLLMSERVSLMDSGLYMIVSVWVRCYNTSDW